MNVQDCAKSKGVKGIAERARLRKKGNNERVKPRKKGARGVTNGQDCANRAKE